MDKVLFNINKEEIISRLPTLFPYVEINDDYTYNIKRSSDSIDGSYNKIIPDILIPEQITYKDDEYEVIGGNIYSYRYLMSVYYGLINKNVKNDFTDYIDRCIGKKSIPLELFNNDQDLVPSVIYLSQIDDLISELDVIYKKVNFYKENKDSGYFNKEEIEELCCLEKKFYRLGDEKFLLLLRSYIPEKEIIINELYINNRDNKSHITFPVLLRNRYNDLGIFSLYDYPWVSGETYNEGNIVTYNGDSYLCIGYDVKSLTFNEDDFIKIKSQPKKVIGVGSILGNSYTLNDNLLSFPTDSRLNMFRRKKNYQNEYNNYVHTDGELKDWLYYYKVGVHNFRHILDDNGNITHYGNDYTDGKDLHLYGSGIKSIKADNNTLTITFEYYINAHLKADFVRKELLSDGSEVYYFDNFDFDVNEYDDNGNIVSYASKYGRNQGLRIVEKHYYEEDSDLYNLVRGHFGGLNSYVRDYETLMTYKFTFNKSNDYIMGYYNKGPREDLLYNHLIRHDNLVGVSYQPTIVDKIYIERGNAAAFESHLKLGEISSIEDMETYTNGSFFKFK